MEGLVHFYTGDGKGKTTAAIGLAVRAAGAGRKVVFAQFMKGMDTSELAPLKTLGVQVVRKGTVTKFVPYMTEDERALCAAQQAETLAEARRLVPEDGVLVLDEIASAVTTGMVPAEDVLALLNAKPAGTEVVMTGRQPPQALLDKADYISEMRCVRHPSDTKGVGARKGIEY